MKPFLPLKMIGFTQQRIKWFPNSIPVWRSGRHSKCRHQLTHETATNNCIHMNKDVTSIHCLCNKSIPYTRLYYMLHGNSLYYLLHTFTRVPAMTAEVILLASYCLLINLPAKVRVKKRSSMSCVVKGSHSAMLPANPRIYLQME